MNLVFALSATITLFYLIFYSISPKSRKLLEILHYSGILVLAAYLALIIVIYEFRDGKIGGRDQQITFYCFLAVGLVASIVLLVIIDLKLSQYISFALLGSIILLILSLDYTNYASKRLIKLFYGPVFFEFLLLLFFILLFIFRIPELCCMQTRWANMYLSS